MGPVRLPPIERRGPVWLEHLRDGPPAALANLRGMKRSWDEYPSAMDFLRPDSPNHLWKAFQTDLYRTAIGQVASQSPGTALRILDAGCGIGRLLVPMAVDGHHLLGIDASLRSLQAAQQHLAPLLEADPELGKRVRLVWDDMATAEISEGPFDLVLALELLCYLDSPQETAAKLAEVLRPGGVLVASIEAWPGALLADPAGLGPSGLDRALSRHILSVQDDRWVHALQADEFEAILRAVGLEPRWIRGMHYLLDGPFGALVDPTQMGRAGYCKELTRLEDSLATGQSTAKLPRAWLAVADKGQR